MRGKRNITGANSPKNISNNLINKTEIIAPQNQPRSPRNPQKRIKYKKNGNKLNLWKSTKDLRAQKSEISTEDMQQKQELLQFNQKIKNSSIIIKEKKQFICTNTKQDSNKRQKITQKEGIQKRSKQMKQKEEIQMMAQSSNSVTISTQLQQSYLNKLQQLQTHTIQFQNQMQKKDRIIFELKKQNKQIMNKYERLIQQNKIKLLKQKVTKFNEEGDQIRRLKQRITQLQEQLKNLKQNQRKKIIFSDLQIKNQNLLPTLDIKFAESEVFQVVETIQYQQKKQNIQKKQQEKISFTQHKLNQTINSQSIIISDQAQNIKELGRKLQKNEERITELKNDNFNLRNKLIQSLRGKLQKKQIADVQKLKKKQQVKNRLKKIMETTQKQREIFQTLKQN